MANEEFIRFVEMPCVLLHGRREIRLFILTKCLMRKQISEQWMTIDLRQCTCFDCANECIWISGVLGERVTETMFGSHMTEIIYGS